MVHHFGKLRASKEVDRHSLVTRNFILICIPKMNEYKCPQEGWSKNIHGSSFIIYPNGKQPGHPLAEE